MSFDDLWTRYMRVGTPDAYAARGWNMGRLLRDVRLSGQVTGEDAADVANTIAAELEARGYPLAHDVETLTLTTAHAASSYGQPVLLLDGDAFGPGDMTPAGMTGAELVTTWAARFIREDR